MKQLSIKDLLPNTDYAVQIRVVTAEDTSEWSRRFLFKTIDDDIVPKTPTNLTFVAGDDVFIAEWDRVVLNTDNSHAKIVNYELELTDPGGRKESINFNPSFEPGQQRVGYTLTPERIRAKFGSFKKTLTLRVRAQNASENISAWSSSATATLAPPGAPTNAVVTPVSMGLEISWTPPANTSNIVGYRVYTSQASADFSITGLKPVYEGTNAFYKFISTVQTLQYFKIYSYNRDGQMSTALLAQGTPLEIADFTPPPGVTGLTGSVTTAANGKTATGSVTWTHAGGADLSGFNLRFRPTGTTVWGGVALDASARSATFDAKPYTNYEGMIEALDAENNSSGWSPIVQFAGQTNTAPPAVTGLAAAQVNIDSIKYTWTESTATDVAGQAGSYDLQVGTDATFATNSTIIRTGYPFEEVTVLMPNTTYYARVRAVDSAGLAGSWSSSVTAKTGSYPTTALTDGKVPGTAPTPTLVGGIGYLYATWAPVTTAVDGTTQYDTVTYEVHLGTASGFTPSAATKVFETAATSGIIDVLPGTTTGLTYGSTYFVRLIAKDRDGSGAAGPTSASATPVKNTMGDLAADVTAAALGGATKTEHDALSGIVNAPSGATNLFTSSRTFSGSRYTQLIAGATVTTASTAGPLIAADGTYPNVNAIRLTAGASGMNMRIREVKQTGWHTLSFWYKRAGAADATFTPDINDQGYVTFTATSAWQKGSISANVTTLNATYNFVDFSLPANGDIYIYHPMLETGRLPSDYKPSPEEQYADSLSVAASSANGVNKVYNLTSVPTGNTDSNGRAYVIGDTAFVRTDTANPTRITGQYEYTAASTWSPRTLSHQVISSIDVGNMTVIGKLGATNIEATSLTIGQGQVTNLSTDLSARPLTTAVNAQVATAQANAINAQFQNSNANFADWTGTYPAGWGNWNGSVPAKETSIVRVGPNAVRFNPTGTEDMGMQEATALDSLPYEEYIVIEADAYLVSGTFSGAGVLLDFNGATAPNRVLLNFASMEPSPATGKWYRFTKTFKRPNAAGTWASWSSWIMGNWAELGTKSAKNVIFDKVGYRAATQEEITAYNTPGNISTAKSEAISDAAADATTKAGNARTGAVSDIKTVWGGDPNSTTINGGVIRTRTILAQSLTMGDFTNYIADADLLEPTFANWTGGATRVAPTGTTPGYIEWTAAVGANAHIYNLYEFDVKEGDKFYYEFEYSSPSTNTASLNLSPSIHSLNPDGTTYTWPQVAAIAVAANTAWTKTFGTITIGAGTHIRGRWDPFAQSTVAGQKIRMRNMILRRALGAELVVDGTIRASALTTGTFTSGIITIGAGGSLRTNNGAVTITDQGITVTAAATGGISTTALTTGDITATATVTVKGNINVGTGFIQSQQFIDSGGASGFQLSNTGLIIKSGSVSAGTITTGSISGGAAITLAGSSYIHVSSGFIRGGGYTGTTAGSNPSGVGWYIGSDGANLPKGTVYASDIQSGSISSADLQITGTGSIYGTGWSLGPTGLSIGTTATGTSIDGSAIKTGSIQSNDWNGSTTGWIITKTGGATFNSITIRSSTIIGGDIATPGFVDGGSTGWSLSSSGDFKANSGTFRGSLAAASGTFAGNLIGGGISTGNSVNEASIEIGYNAAGKNTIIFRGASGVRRGSITLNSSSNFSFQGTSNEAMSITDSGVSIVGPLDVAKIAGGTDGLEVQGTGGIYIANLSSTYAAGSNASPNVLVGTSGRLNKTSFVAASAGSSRRFKKNISPLYNKDQLLDNMRKLEPVEFEWNGDWLNEPRGRNLGFIAEDVYNLGLGQFVMYAEAPFSSEYIIAGLNYGKMVVPLLMMVKDLEKERDDMKSRVERLEDLVTQLMERQS